MQDLNEFVMMELTTPLERLNLLNDNYLINKEKLNRLSEFEARIITSTLTWKNTASQLRSHALDQCKLWVHEFKTHDDRIEFLKEALKLPIICDRTGCSSVIGRETPAFTELSELIKNYERRREDMNNNLANFKDLRL